MPPLGNLFLSPDVVTHSGAGSNGEGTALIYKLAALVELYLVILENSGFVHLRGLPRMRGPLSAPLGPGGWVKMNAS
jgi:hypothetical protein